MVTGSCPQFARNRRLHRQRLASIRAHRCRAIVAAIGQLALPPLLGRRMYEYPDHDLRELLERPWRLIYQVQPDVIEIVTVKHYRQRLPKNPTVLRGGEDTI